MPKLDIDYWIDALIKDLRTADSYMQQAVKSVSRSDQEHYVDAADQWFKCVDIDRGVIRQMTENGSA